MRLRNKHIRIFPTEPRRINRKELKNAIDIALRYEKEAMHNDLGPVVGILSKLTSEIEDALKK